MHTLSVTKGRLKASPPEHAAGLSPWRGKAAWLVHCGKGMPFKGQKVGRKKHTAERQAHLYLLSTATPSHYAVSPAASFGRDTCICVQTQEWFQGWPESTLS